MWLLDNSCDNQTFSSSVILSCFNSWPFKTASDVSSAIYEFNSSIFPVHTDPSRDLYTTDYQKNMRFIILDSKYDRGFLHLTATAGSHIKWEWMSNFTRCPYITRWHTGSNQVCRMQGPCLNHQVTESSLNTRHKQVRNAHCTATANLNNISTQNNQSQTC